jgi:lactoylglutathione lyase
MDKQNSIPGSFHFGFYEVHLPVLEVERAIDFYVSKLDFELGFRKGAKSALLLYNDGQAQSMLGLYAVDRIERPLHVSFRMAESVADKMVELLIERGIEPIYPPSAPLQGPVTEPIVHGWMPAAAVFFRDPDGHLLELIAELSDSPRPDVLYMPLSRWRTTSQPAD